MTTSTDLDRQRFRFVLVTFGLLLAACVVEWWLHLGWKAITLHTAVILGLDVAWAAVRRDGLMARWLVFGVAAGVAELVADAYMVESTGSLVYYPGGPTLWASPAYMPFAWAMVLIQVGLIADHLVQRWSLPRAAAMTALLGGVNIPLYEHLAAGARWWYYHHTPMIGGAPFYIILAEALLVLPLPWVALRLRRGAEKGGWGEVAALGAVVEGLAMFVAVVLAWWLLGPCNGAVLQLPCGGG